MNEQLTKVLEILHQMAKCERTIAFKCNDGSVNINVRTLECTFIGHFGNLVQMHIIKKGIEAKSNFIKQLIILSAHMDQYSMKHGGFNVITN